jgi:hypothetical protein
LLGIEACDLEPGVQEVATHGRDVDPVDLGSRGYLAPVDCGDDGSLESRLEDGCAGFAAKHGNDRGRIQNAPAAHSAS